MEIPRQPDRKTIHDRVVALPLAEHGNAIDEKTALAIYEDLRQNGSVIPGHIQDLIDGLTDEIAAKVNIPLPLLRGTIARAAIAGAAQAVSDTGQSIIDIDHFRELIQLESNNAPYTDDGGSPAA